MSKSVNRRLQTVESTVSSLVSKSRVTAQTDSTQTTAITAAQTVLSSLGSRLNQLEQNVTSLALVTAPEVAANTNVLGSLTTRLDSVEQNVDSLQNSVVGVQTVLGTYAKQTDLTATSTALTGLTSRTNTLESVLNTRAHTDALNATNTALSSTNAAVLALTGRVTNTESVQVSTANSLTALTSRVSAAESVITTCAKTSDLINTNNAVTTLTTRVSNAESGLTSSNNTVTSLTTRMTNVEAVAAAAARANDLITTNTNVTNLTTRLGNDEYTFNARIAHLEDTVPDLVTTGQLNTTNTNVANLTSRVTTAENSLVSQGARLTNIETTALNDQMRGWAVSSVGSFNRGNKIVSMDSDPVNGGVMALDSGGYVYLSMDGSATFTQVYSVAPSPAMRITYGNGIWVICRSGGSAVAYSSNTGSTWQSLSGSGMLHGMVYLSTFNQWLGLGVSGQSLVINVYSANLQTVASTLSLNVLPAAGVTVTDFVVGGGGTWCVAVLSSTAGQYGLTAIRNPFTLGSTTASPIGNLWVGIGSFNGVDYSPAKDVFVVATGNAGSFLVSGSSATATLGAVTGWSTVNIPSLIGIPRCICYEGSNNLFVAAGGPGTSQYSVVYSVDGIQWYPSYTYSVDPRVPSAVVYDRVNDLWLVAVYASGQVVTVFSSTTYPSSYTQRKLAGTNNSLKSLTGSYNATVSNLNTLQTNYNTTASDLATLQVNYNNTASDVGLLNTQVTSLGNQLNYGFSSTLNNAIYVAMIGLGPSAQQVSIEYHWTKVMSTVTLQGRIIIPGSVETANGVSNGIIKFKLPISIAPDTFSNPGTITYTYNPGTSTSMTRYNPRVLGHVFADSKTIQAAIDSFEVYGEPGTSDVVAILVNNNTSYSNACFHFRITYSLTSIKYSTAITNQTSNTSGIVYV